MSDEKAFLDLSARIPYQAIVDRPNLQLPNGAKVAVWVIVNVEHWRMQGAMPRTVLPPPMRQPLLPDVPNWSWHEYGMRVGFWRHLKAIQERGIRASLAINASVCTVYPRVAEAALEAGWEFMGHGYFQQPTHSIEDEAEAFAKAVTEIANFAGVAPRAWESPGLTETTQTLDVLRKNGIEFVADWVIDDLPETIATPHGDVTTLPYTVETNDIAIYALQNHASDALFERGKAQFDRFYLEGADCPRVMAISVHPYITGVPHRIGALEALLDYIQGHDKVAWMSANEVGDWYNGELRRLGIASA